ncbi:SDR family oxidoreductase [Thioclava sp. DLFJ5-1]|nr:SDR family oxidoreductase [Thioclava sp. DLFJ5-1]
MTVAARAIAEAEEVAQAIALLLSKEAGVVTGAALPIEGGFLSV